MKYMTIDRTRVPALGLGTYQLEGENCVRGVAHALELGYRHIDTAQDYGNEAEVGAGIRASGVERSEVFLTTKFHRGHCTYDAVFVARAAHWHSLARSASSSSSAAFSAKSSGSLVFQHVDGGIAS